MVEDSHDQDQPEELKDVMISAIDVRHSSSWVAAVR